MKISSKVAILFTFLLTQFAFSAVDFNGLKDSFKKVADFLQKEDKVKITDIPLINKVPLPPQMKDVADKIFIEKPRILLDKDTKSLFLIGGMRFKDKPLVARVRFGFSSDQQLDDMKGLKNSIEKDKDKDKEEKEEKKSFKQKLADAKEKIRGFKADPKGKIKKGIKSGAKSAAKKIASKLALSFAIELPGNWTYFDFMPGIKSKLPQVMQDMVGSIGFENSALVISLGDYEDPEFGAIQSGINIMTTPRYGGQLKKLEKIFGEEFGKLEFRGLLAANLSLAGSFLKVTVPWNVPLIKPNKNLDLKVTTNGITFILGIQEFVPFAPVPRLKIQTGINTHLPKQPEPFDLDGFVDIYPQKAEVAGVMEGFLDGGFMGLPIKVGNLGLGFTIDFAAWAETAGAWPIYGGSVKSALHIGDKKMDTAGKFELSGSGGLGDLILAGNFDGEFTREDIVKFAIQTMQLIGKISGKSVDKDKIAKDIAKALPQFKLMATKAVIAYKDGELLGDQYNKGVHFYSGFELGPAKGRVEVMVGSKGIKLAGYLGEINLGNGAFVISGAGLDKKRGTNDDGPTFSGEISANNQNFYLDALLKIPALKISSDSKIDLSLAGASLNIQHKLGDLFEVNSILEGDVSDLDSWKIEGSIKRNTLTKLGSFLQSAASAMQEDARRDLTKAQNDIERARNIAKGDIDRWVQEKIQGTNDEIRKTKEEIEGVKRRCANAHWAAKAFVCTAAGPTLAVLGSKLGALELHKKVTLDKLIKEVGKFGVEVGTRTAQAAVKVAEDSAKVISDIMNLFGKIAAGGFNITNIDYKGTLKGLIKDGKTPWTRVRGTIGGRDFDHIIEFDFKNPKKSAENILNIFKSMILGKDIKKPVDQSGNAINVTNLIDRVVLVKILNDKNELKEFEIGAEKSETINFSGNIQEISVRRQENAPGWYHGWNNYYGKEYANILNSQSLTIDYIKIQGKYAPGLVPGRVSIESSGQRTAVL